jgi:succinyl-CoA synthetase beta subunit
LPWSIEVNLHEYQAKALLKEYGLPVPKGMVIESIEQLVSAVSNLKGEKWVVKAQVHAGGRGKAGGVQIATSKEALIEIAKNLLHTNLVTYQTNAKGLPVNQLLIEEVSDITRELYLGAVLDRGTAMLTFIISTEGGIEIEKVANTNPEKILKLTLHPLIGILPYQVRDLAEALKLNSATTKQLQTILTTLSQLFVACDCSLLEINPLALTSAGELLCLDCKINIDDNALFRQPALYALRDKTQENTKELQAREVDLNYIALDGEIGCMVNGAGLAMATMDLIKLYGGNPANFLDVGGSATKERVTAAFKIILSDKGVKAILVNIFGGIVRCDLIAEGIIAAVAEVGITVPVVVRLEGNQAQKATQLLNGSGLNVVAAKSFEEAAIAVVKAAKGAV